MNNNNIKLSLLKIISPLTLSLILSNAAYGHGLLKVYQLAAKKDPQLQQAFADFKSVEQNIPIAVADMLPEVTLNAGISYDKMLDFTLNPTIFPNDQTEHPSINSRFFSVNLTQPLFYWDRIHRYLQSEKEVEKAIHDLEIAKEDLLIRVSEAYFNVLEAEDTLEFVSTERRSVEQLYKESLERFNVGLIPIADVDEAQARLDLKTADEIQATNDVHNRYDELIEIIGDNINHANILTSKFKPSSPKPTDVRKWIKMAMDRNHTYTSQKLNLEITEKNEDIAFAGHLPTLDATAQYRGTKSSRSLQVDDVSAAKGYISSYGGSIEGELEIFGGGGTQAEIEKTEYNTKAESYNTERVRRETLSDTKQAYRNVLTNIKQIAALEQAVVSGLSALEATKASYEVGTRASIDVLDRLTDLYEQKQRLSESRYEYIKNVLELKRQAGVLTNKDVLTIDKWLIESKNRVRDNSDVKSSILQTVQDRDKKLYDNIKTKKKPKIQLIEEPITKPSTKQKPKAKPKTTSKTTSEKSSANKNEHPELEALEKKLLELEGVKSETKPSKTVKIKQKSKAKPTELKQDKESYPELRKLEEKLLEKKGVKSYVKPTSKQSSQKKPVENSKRLAPSVESEEEDKMLRKLESELRRIIEEGNIE